MTQPEIRTVAVNGFPCRVWSKGRGPKVGFLAGIGGLPKWTPFLEQLSEKYTVIAPSLPGFPGGGAGHTVLDSHLDWIVAARNLIELADLNDCHLVGSSVGASLAAEMAALWPDSVRKLALIAPFGVFDDAHPPGHPWAHLSPHLPALYCSDPDKFVDLQVPLQGADPIEWKIEAARAQEAAARFYWPIGNTGIERRLPLIKAPTLLLWGGSDRILPYSYANRFVQGISSATRIGIIEGAGHLAELDQPQAVAAQIDQWIGG